ncbi:exosortase F system-associated protein [Flavobacterium sp. NST-5]|uniref:Exosortase F system-associated protein n=1 Tax=Flavobacterium ichthyis TaxID=2698827 RepID=A0ABW9Z544_9FLAO|nr:exosortase F system-associated protein [Flavobacterium ichthyis]NBL63804.1 exosortase F system-associated protein [Flavobacterium ichthyis]
MQKVLKYWKEILASVFLVAIFALIRMFETSYYDPFLVYFKGDYTNLPYPEFNGLKLFLSLLLRYFLNSVVTLILIQILFKDKNLTKFAGILLVIFLMILMVAFFILANSENTQQSFLFYVRRFLIQPLFAILFLPAIFYQKKLEKK